MFKGPITWITHIGVAVAVLVVAMLFHSVSVSKIKTKHALELAKQAKELKDKCREDKLETETRYNELQNNLDANAAELDRLHKLSTTCVVTSPKPSAKYDEAKSDEGLSVTYGTTSYAFRLYAKDAEDVGDQLDACQAYVRRNLYND